MNTTAIVLAGGKGSRMNYQEKAWMLYRNQPLLTHVLDSIEHQVDSILISRNNLDDKRYFDLPYHCIADATEPEDQKGPLSGINACYSHVATPLTLVVPCDTPHLPANLVRTLLPGLNDASIAVAHDGQHEQPLVFLAKTQALESIESYLDSGKRSVKGWLETTDRHLVHFEDGLHQFDNINTIGQLL